MQAIPRENTPDDRDRIIVSIVPNTTACWILNQETLWERLPHDPPSIFMNITSSQVPALQAKLRTTSKSSSSARTVLEC